jgi:hypothetical protein
MGTVGITTYLPGSTEDAYSLPERLGIELDRIARGRALAWMATEELIDEIKTRAARHLLDRGLRVSMPYFDDRRLALRYREFTVIPQGRILFVPAFVVVAAEREIARVQAATEFNPTTRDHLLEGLQRLASAFGSSTPEGRVVDPGTR